MLRTGMMRNDRREMILDDIRCHDDIRCDMNAFLSFHLRNSNKNWHRWHYYFTYCETGFRRKHIDVWQFLGEQLPRHANAATGMKCTVVGCPGVFRNPRDLFMLLEGPIFHKVHVRPIGSNRCRFAAA